MDINKVILMGRAGRDPEIFKTNKGEEGARLALATGSSTWDAEKNQYVTNTTWHEIIVFSDWLVKNIREKVTKGTSIYVEGSIKNNEYIGKDGVKRHSMQILVSKFGGIIRIAEQPKKSIAQQASQRETKNTDDELYDGNYITDNFVDDELPF